MTARMLRRSVVRTFLSLAPLACASFLATGCGGESYAPEMRYGIRTDPLVLKTPTEDPPKMDTPGVLDHDQILPEVANAEKNKGGVLAVSDVSAEKRADLNAELERVFGTPAAPRVKYEGEFADVLPVLKLDEATLAQGSTLFRRHCLHCHGVTGNGRGPTSAWVNPHPRDFRRGKFKFTSSEAGEGPRRARREDLIRTLRQGVETTSMPSFNLLKDAELEALASYVIHLSMRGEFEYNMLSELGKKENASATVKSLQADQSVTLDDIVKNWKQTMDKAVQPKPFPYKSAEEVKTVSVTNGHKLFREKGCLGCHKDYGRADGFRYDAWGTIVRPANLTLNSYRGGRRPVDLYWRIHGINGASMPSAADTVQSGNDHWDLVNFLLALPYPAMLPDAIRTEVYGSKARRPAVADAPRRTDQVAAAE